MRRRTFLQSAAVLSAAAAASAADDQPAVPIRLGFDTYSIRAFHWKAIQLIDYAASLKLDTIQISSLDDYESHEPAYLAQVKDHAARVGIALDGGMGCICPLSTSWNAKNGDPKENLLRGLRVANANRATSIRRFLC